MSTHPPYAIGIDVGTSTVQVALVNEDGVVDVLEERMRRRDARRVADHAFENMLATSGRSRDEVVYVASTGDDEAVPFADGHFFGMTTHARGAVELDPKARTALDLGALHARAIRFDERGKVLAHRMTGQCASGSGQFLENIARYLGVTLDEIGPLSLQSTHPKPPSGICAVLAETDVINLVSSGVPTADIVKGLHVSIAQRLVRLLRGAKAEGRVLVTGGGSRDIGLIEAIRERLADDEKVDVELVTHPMAPAAGAIGAACWGLVRYEKLRAGA